MINKLPLNVAMTSNTCVKSINNFNHTLQKEKIFLWMASMGFISGSYFA